MAYTFSSVRCATAIRMELPAIHAGTATTSTTSSSDRLTEPLSIASIDKGDGRLRRTSGSSSRAKRLFLPAVRQDNNARDDPPKQAHGTSRPYTSAIAATRLKAKRREKDIGVA